jgi:hypothetical protein
MLLLVFFCPGELMRVLSAGSGALFNAGAFFVNKKMDSLPQFTL